MTNPQGSGMERRLRRMRRMLWAALGLLAVNSLVMLLLADPRTPLPAPAVPGQGLPSGASPRSP
jgi:hypothetical protein